ncbi:hypothetical protein [Microlunatus flavus]|uniref:Uncharacterized protein n=1 Tax=Microlunatus flavus TaxID=1036181 RepID=A0A1H9LL53_9ACTN|nr:hypothetical protein [Microlunatus flavus]SER12150.1 hypothetical protein SAMN05421756_1097 [Microlunatus flavus]
MNNMEEREEHVKELAEKGGLIVFKQRDPRAPDYGTYGVARDTGNPANWRGIDLIAGDPNTGFGLSLQDVEQIVSNPEQNRSLLGGNL